MLRAARDGKSLAASSRANGRFAYVNRPSIFRTVVSSRGGALRRKMRAMHLGPSEGHCAADVPYRACADWQIVKSAQLLVAAEAGVALKGGDADEGSFSDQHIAVCNGSMHTAIAHVVLARRIVGSGHGGRLGLQYDNCV